MKGSKKFHGQKLVELKITEHFLNILDCETFFPKEDLFIDFSPVTSIYFKEHSLGHAVLEAANLMAASSICELP